MSRNRWTMALGLAWASLATAGEGTVWQGRLLDASGAPIQGTVSLTVEAFSASTGGTSLATRTVNATATDGYVSVDLPATWTAGATSVADAWVEVRLDTTALGPRQSLTSSPTSVRAARVYVVSSVGTCGTAEQGSIRWDTTVGTLRVCVDGQWRSVSASAGSGPGSVQTNPVASCAAVSTTGSYWVDYGTGAVQLTCDPGAGWTYVLDYTDSNASNDIPDASASIATGFRTANAYYIGNTALNALPFADAEWCTSNGTQTTCFPITDADWSFTLGDVDSLIGPKRRVIAALSGQVDDGRTEDGANGDFYATRALAQPPVCPGPSYALVLTDHGRIRQWVGDDADWHTWGNGLGLFKNGSNFYGVNNELTWAAQNLTPSTLCGPEWERFFIRVRQETPGLAGSNRSSSVTNCAAVSAARGPLDGFYWIDPDGGSKNNAGRVYCDFTNNWTYPLYYVDDNAKNDIPDSRWVIADGFSSPNATYVGNVVLNNLTFTTAEWCMSNSVQTSCFPIQDNYFTYTGAELAALTGNKRKIIGALSGQVDDGRTEDGASGDFYSFRTASKPPICPSPAYVNDLPNHGHIRQWSGNDADWHTWGNGLSLYKNGSNTYGPHNELMWGAENVSPNTLCGPEWETFYVRIR